jgi:hypothetical protein
MAANTFSALTNPTPSATMGGLQQPAPVGKWVISGTGYGFPGLTQAQKIKIQDQTAALGDLSSTAVYINDVTGAVSLGQPPAGQIAYNVDRSGNPVQVTDAAGNITPEWQAVLAGSHGGSFFGPGLGGILGGLAAGSAFLPAAVGALGAGAAAAPAASTSEAVLGPATGFVPSSLTTGAGATAAQGAAGGFSVIPGSTSLGGALESAVGNAAGQSLIPGSLGTAGVAGSAISPAAQALLAGGAGAAGAAVGGAAGGAGATGAATTAAGAATGAGGALNRILAGTGTAGDFLTLGIPATGAVASLLAGANASSASKDAAQAQEQAAQAAIAEQRRQFDVTQANNAPFLATGTAANARLSQLLGTAPGYTGSDAGSLTKPFTSEDLNADPVYNSGLQFGLDQGTKAINARAIAGGNYDSGATLKALTQFGNDYGSTKANDAFNRFQTTQGNTFNRLSGVSGTGQTAVGQVAAAGQNATNNISGLLTDQGSARSAGIVGGANAVTGAAGNINSLANNFSSNATLQALLGQRQPTYFANG